MSSRARGFSLIERSLGESGWTDRGPPIERDGCAPSSYTRDELISERTQANVATQAASRRARLANRSMLLTGWVVVLS